MKMPKKQTYPTITSEVRIIKEYNGKIRVKLTDKCNLHCPFCHFEGTPEIEEISPKDPILLKWLNIFKDYFDKVHLTGGEPLLYSSLKEIIEVFNKHGYKVAMTTNGTFLNDSFRELLPSLDYINVSFHTQNPKYFKYFVTHKRALFFIEKIKDTILFLKETFKRVRINAVVSPNPEQKIEEIMDFSFRNNILLKLVPDWRFYEEAERFIEEILNQHGFVLDSIILKMPSSNIRKIFKDSYGNKIEVKSLKPFYLSSWCDKCTLKEKCLETFAFLRLEGNPLRFKPCIYKPSIDVEMFSKIVWPSLKKEMEKALKYKEDKNER